MFMKIGSSSVFPRISFCLNIQQHNKFRYNVEQGIPIKNRTLLIFIIYLYEKLLLGIYRHM